MKKRPAVRCPTYEASFHAPTTESPRTDPSAAKPQSAAPGVNNNWRRLGWSWTSTRPSPGVKHETWRPRLEVKSTSTVARRPAKGRPRITTSVSLPVTEQMPRYEAAGVAQTWRRRR